MALMFLTLTVRCRGVSYGDTGTSLEFPVSTSMQPAPAWRKLQSGPMRPSTFIHLNIAFLWRSWWKRRNYLLAVKMCNWNCMFKQVEVGYRYFMNPINSVSLNKMLPWPSPTTPTLFVTAYCLSCWHQHICLEGLISLDVQKSPPKTYHIEIPLIKA